MRNPSFLFDSRFKKNYLVFGNFKKLLPLLRLRLFPRNVTDKAILKLQSVVKFGSSKNVEPRLISSLNRCFKDINSYILFKTQDYKETLYIGILEADQELYFIKIFQSYEETIFQDNQSRFVNQHFARYFITVPPEKYFDNILVSKFIAHQNKVVDDAEQKIIAMSKELIEQSAITKIPSDIIPIDLFFILSDQAELTTKIQSWLTKHSSTLPIIPIHGDMTPWNMFVDKNGQTILVDYEAAGWHVPFYDYFHYILQPIGLKDRTVSISRLVPDLDYSLQYEALCLYLIDQLYKHHSQIKQFGYNDKALQNLVQNKTQWLYELLDAR